jgi:two-component system, response regulator PdtaR
VVTEIEMPAGSMVGLELTRMVRQRWLGIGVVISLGRALPEPGDLSAKVAYIARPYLPDTIINVFGQMATPQVVELPSDQSA